MSKFKKISKQLTVSKDSRQGLAVIVNLIVRDLDEFGKDWVLRATNNMGEIRNHAQNGLLRCYYSEIQKSHWAKQQQMSLFDVEIYCKRYIIIDILKFQACKDTILGIKAKTQSDVVSGLLSCGASEELKITYLSTEGWSSILDTEHFKKYLEAIEHHFFDKLNYRLESINETKRREAFG